MYEAYTQPSAHANHGERVISGKRLVQTATDIFVGWGTLHGNDYYVRQFRDMKIIPSTDLIAPRLAEFATACGETLARAHARTGDPVAIDAYIGKGKKFAAAMGRFARAYADQNEHDRAQLVSAIASGDRRIPAGLELHALSLPAPIPRRPWRSTGERGGRRDEDGGMEIADVEGGSELGPGPCHAAAESRAAQRGSPGPAQEGRCNGRSRR